MNKDIYIITNDVNNKAYIGQTNNVTLRWQQHKSAAKQKTNDTLICKAMQELGVEHFSLSILEQDVENADERERFWITEKNTLFPNGYNKIPGGIQHNGGTEHYLAKLNKEQLASLIVDISETKISFEKLAAKYNISMAVVCAINNGESYYNKNLAYPLRQTRYEKKKFERLVYSLKYELDKSMTDIAKEYNVDISNLSEINQGIIRHVDWVTYPIRSGKVMFDGYRHVKEIIELLKDPSIQQKDIAKMFNVSKGLISAINYGRSYAQKGVNYPIRVNYQQNKTPLKLSENEITELENYLRNTTISMRKLAEKYECCVDSIMNFNNGSIKKYHKPNIQYPIRKR